MNEPDNQGIDLRLSTLADQVGAYPTALPSVHERIAAMYWRPGGCTAITPVPVLTNRKTTPVGSGRFRDDRPSPAT